MMFIHTSHYITQLYYITGAFCHVDPKNVISVHDVSNIYHVPMMLNDQGVNITIKKFLSLQDMKSQQDFRIWKTMASNIDEAVINISSTVRIAIIGKYTGLSDSYLSVIKSLNHSGIHLNRNVQIDWIDATELENGDKKSEAWK